MAEVNNTAVTELVSPFETNATFKTNLEKLTELRKDGDSKLIALKSENKNVKANKNLDPQTRSQIIESNMYLMNKAKKVSIENQEEIAAIVKDTAILAKQEGKSYYLAVKDVELQKREEIKTNYSAKVSEIEDDHRTRLAAIGNVINVSDEDLEKEKAKIEERYRAREQEITDLKLSSDDEAKARENNKRMLEKNLSFAQKKLYEEARHEHTLKLKAEKILYKSQLEEAKSSRNIALDASKLDLFNSYLEKYGYLGKLRNNKHTIGENLEYKYRNYIYSFNTRNFLLKNALYFVAIVLFIVFIVVAAAKNQTLLTGNNIVSILSQSSTKLFYSLGVAGLILLGGTDLSVGRITALGTMMTCLFTSGNIYNFNSSTFGQFTIDVSGMGAGAGIITGLLVSIVTCVIFTSIAGFFTAKFKMHPFITTLSTQLLCFGILMITFASVASFNMQDDISLGIKGNNGVYLIIYAVIATLLVWFIWNKTKFGKNMFAVGGNSEAAAVSGINVFWTTMFVFIMAGILYGFGGFFEAARTPIASPSTGYGTELNAIAACVIGGVSFSGGIGKISGVVVGTIIFQGLTFCLTYIGVDANIQYIFQGVIIMAAVCLDSLKYLKKK